MNEGTPYHLIIISILIMIVLASSVILIFFIYNKKVISSLKEAHLKETEYQDRLLTSNINTQESERARIARDLHDDVGSKLNIINLNLNLLKTALKRNENTEEILYQIESSLSEGIERSRSIAHELLPPILTKFGIQSAINALASKINMTGQVSFTSSIAEDWSKLTINQELHIYRVIQELTNNTLKHANAKTIDISSTMSDNQLMLIYSDDGIGMNLNDFKGKGLGMDNIEIRAKLMNAKVEVKSQLKKGIEVILRIPLNPITN